MKSPPGGGGGGELKKKKKAKPEEQLSAEPPLVHDNTHAEPKHTRSLVLTMFLSLPLSLSLAQCAEASLIKSCVPSQVTLQEGPHKTEFPRSSYSLCARVCVCVSTLNETGQLITAPV